MNRTSDNNMGEFLRSLFESLGNWFVKHARIVMPIILAVGVIATIVISVGANKKEAEQQEDIETNSVVEEVPEVSTAIPKVALQENTDPKITELIQTYYTAQAAGDIETIKALVSAIDETEILRFEETSKYVDTYPTLDIYTKAGPLENTYLVYVCSELKFFDYEETIPGMSVFYVCTDENGNYYINQDEATSDSELMYIETVSLQDDVVDLNNKVVVEYNNMLAEDENLAQLILDLNKEIEKNVGGILAQAAESGDSDTESEGTEAEGEEATDSSGPELVATKVRATEVVNIRSSDSETADKLGKAAIGDEFPLLEKKGNGWSKIEYQGSDAYIKSEFLEDIEMAQVDQTAEEENDEPAAVETASTGTVTVIENVRIRSGASENSEKLGTAYAGEKLELIMKQADGWTKIKYNGKTAYVKSDYVK